jgi:hypothetical protein
MPAEPKLPATPKHLGPEARKLWRQITAEYELEAHHEALLERACESLDRMRLPPAPWSAIAGSLSPASCASSD